MPAEAPATYWCNRIIEFEAQAERTEAQLRRLQAERETLLEVLEAKPDDTLLGRLHTLKAEIFATQATLIDCRAAISVARGHLALALDRQSRSATAA